MDRNRPRPDPRDRRHRVPHPPDDDGTAVTDTYSITIDDQTLGPFPTGPDPTNLDAPVTGRLVRIDADRTTGGKTGATEMEIYRTG